MKGKIILMVGPPCSGKSTWSKLYLKENPNAVRINRDDLRMMLTGNPVPDYKVEHIVSIMVSQGLDLALELGKTVLIDQTNCKLKYINWFIFRYEDIVDIEFKVFDIELKELLKRNQMRAIATKMLPIPDEVVKRFHGDFQILKSSFDFKTIKRKTDE